MKITFSNLGAIKKTTLDLRPLTVIIGPNNTNKTYIAYSIYGLWQKFATNLGEFIFDNLDLLEVEDEDLTIKIDREFAKVFSDYLTKVCENFKEELNIFFQDTSQKIFDLTEFDIETTIKDIQSAFESVISKSEYAHIKKSITDSADIFVFKYDLLDSDSKFTPRQQKMRFRLRLYVAIIRLVFPQPFLLPAERNAFVITYKMLANRRYKFLRKTQREMFSLRFEERQLDLLKEQGDIRYPQPIEDFLDFLADVELENSVENSSNLDNKIYQTIANNIETFIQGKNTTNFVPTKLGGKEIKINVKKGLDIDLYNASSSIKQLAPLLLYLRYRARENDLLIIDEPEMNLHPESQAKLLEVLGMLVNAGVNVLLTTHSPYFMSHLNNLIAGDTDNEETRQEQAKSLYLKDQTAFLSPDDVSAYEMRQSKNGNVRLHDLKDKDYGIRWDTLSDVSADIQQKFFEIYEKGQETSDGEEE